MTVKGGCGNSHTLSLHSLSEQIIGMVAAEVFLFRIIGQGVIAVVIPVIGMNDDFGFVLACLCSDGLSELASCFGVAVIVAATPCPVSIIDTPGGTAVIRCSGTAPGHSFGHEAEDRIVFLHVGFSCFYDAVRLGESISVSYHLLKRLDGLVNDAFAFLIEFVQQFLVLLVFRDDILGLQNHDAVIDPLAVISAESRQLIHAEPQKPVVGIFKSLLTFEFGEYTVTAREPLEDFEFVDRQITHVRTSGESGAEYDSCSEPCLDFLQIDTDEIAFSDEPLGKSLLDAFPGITRTYMKQSFFHPVAFDAR